MEDSTELNNAIEETLTYILKEREKKPGNTNLLPEENIKIILAAVTTAFSLEPSLLKIKAPIVICGDTHGQLADLLRIFEFTGHPPQTRYLFLGDYVDRGKYSIETVILLFTLKLKYPNHVFLLRGNHEDASLNRVYGFYDECKRKYNVKLWKIFVECFNMIPIAGLVEKKILCMHGGLSPSMTNVAQIDEIKRPCKIPDDGIMCDLLWADPEKDMVGWGPNDRGVSYVFGTDVVKEFTEKNNLELICRAHQVVEDGYEFFANMKLLTIFSAPNYDNTFTNSAAMLCVDKNLKSSIRVLEPRKKYKSRRV